MRNKQLGTVILILITVWMVVLPLWQLADWVKVKREKGDAVQLLYEVAVFQMELMGSTMNEAVQVKTTGQLDEWKRTAYAAAYTHERLAKALGEEAPAKLESMDALLQWIMRAQLGGERPLKQEEQELLKEASKRFKVMFETYVELMDSEGDIIGSAGSGLGQADKDLGEYIRKRMK
jgi:hypothetical protein